MNGNYDAKRQCRTGTYHRRQDMLNIINDVAFSWDMNIKHFKENLQVRKNEFSAEK